VREERRVRRRRDGMRLGMSWNEGKWEIAINPK
jgi:hypothetical protein